MFRKSVLLAFGLSISFSGFALAASEEPVSEQQAQAVEGARKINPAAVEVLLDNNRRMTLDFYGDNVFRIFRDDRGGIIRDPKAEPEARILADSPRRPVSRLDVDQQGDAVVITTGKVRIEINKKTSLFKVINLKDHSVVVEQASPVLFGKGKTSFSLKAKPDEYFYGGGVQNGRFSHKGKVISLPAGSTPIDFAYAIHSAVGNSMIGAKVNNRIASYDAPLHNGDIVEILTSKSAKGPSRDWLNICQSNQARVKIKQWFKREKREENIVRGKASFEAELRHAGVDPDILQNAEILPVILKKVSFECLDDMYAAIGYGGLTAAKAVGRIRDDLTKATRTLAPKPLARQGTPAVNSSGVIVEDIGSCMIKFSRCCTPVPGDEIIGFITKGYGVSVHRKDCPNARAALDPAQKGRWVKVTWAEAPDVMFSTSLEIEADDRDGLMLDVATILTSLRLRTSEMSARSVGGGTAIVCLRFGVHNLTELENVRTRLRGISGVHNVERGTE